MPNPRRAKAPTAVASRTFTAPYPASWFDHFTTWVEKLPAPPWLFYLVLASAVSIAETAVQWQQGAYPPGTFNLAHVWTFANGVYLLAFMHYIDRSAAYAMASSRPLLQSEAGGGESSDNEERTYNHLSYELTTLPARPALAATIGGAAFALLVHLLQSGGGSIPNYMLGTAGTPLSNLFVLAVFIPSNALSVLFLYHTMHQLRRISRVYSHHVRILLYQLEPLYGLSVPCALTAIALVLYPYIWFAASTNARQTVAPVEIGLTILFAAVAAVTFALPLWGAHSRLVAAKKLRLLEASLRFQATTEELHRQLDKGTLGEMDHLNKALASLEIEQAALRRIPTWPWEPGAFRSLLAAVLLPVAVWLLQLILGRLLGQ